MATLEVKLQLVVEQIPYTNQTGISSAINLRYVNQTIDGINIKVSPDLVNTSSIQTGPTNTTAGRVTTNTFSAASSSQYSIATASSYFPYYNSDYLFAGATDNNGNNVYVTLSAIAVDAFRLGDPGRSLSEATNAGVPTQTITINYLGPQQIIDILPQYEWVSLNLPSPPLFTSGSDTIDFNNPTPDQIAAIAAGANLYYSDNGDDTVTLPSASAAASLGGTGIPYLTNQIFSTGTGNHVIKGGDLGYKVALLGAGNNQVTLGNGTNGVSAPFSGNNTVTLGTGNNTLTLGTGTDTVYVTPGTSSEVDTITVGDGQNLVYGGTGTTTITAGTGSNILIGNSAQTTFIGNGGHDQYLVQDGNTINGFTSAGTIDIIASDPAESIDSVVVTTDGSQTVIDAYDQLLTSRVAHITLAGVFQPTNFFGTRAPESNALSGSKDYVQLTYSGQNPTTLFQSIETHVFDAAEMVNHALDRAKLLLGQAFVDQAQDYLVEKMAEEVPPELKPHFADYINIALFSYDLAAATQDYVQGVTNGNQYSLAVAKAAADLFPYNLGGKIAAVGSYVVSKLIDVYFDVLDGDILPPEPKTAVVPIKDSVAAVAPSLSTANATALSTALGQLAGAAGTVTQTTSPTATFPAAAAGQTNVAALDTPADGTSATLPVGYSVLTAQGGGAVTLSDGGASGVLLVGNGAGDTFNSSSKGATLVGGQGANTFNVSGTATVATGDGASTVKTTGAAAVQVTTGTGGSTVVLAGGASTVQSNGQDTVFGGAGTCMITAAKGLVAVGGDGRMSFVGGSATSLVFGAKGGVDYTAGSAYDIAVGGSGTLVAQGGAGGGQFWGNSGSDVLRAGTGATTVLVANSGGQLYSAGSAGNFLIAGAGAATLDGSAAAGNDVFFGGTGQDTIIAGSGNDLIGTGTGTSTVQLGSGKDTVFAFGASTVTAGSGSADVVMGGTVTLNIAQAAGSAARSFALFNFVPGTDKISLAGYGSDAISNAIATQANGSGQTVLTLADNTRIQLIGVSRADANLFG